MKKAIFGGSFDPPHLGHIEIIKQALNNLDIDELLVVPTFLNPFKSESFAPATLRLKWLKDITKEFKNVKVDSFEIDQNRPVSSIETVLHVEKIYKPDEIYFIIGADNLKSLSKWNKFELLNKKVTWVVATRDSLNIPDEFIKLHVEKDISATQLRDKLQEEFISKEIQEEIETFYHKNKGK